MGKTVALKKNAIGDKRCNAERRLEDRLRESVERYRSLFEQAADAIVVFDPQTLAMLEFNDEACRRLGYTRTEFAKLTIPDFEVIESPAETKRHIRQIVARGITVFETKHRTKSGVVLDIEIRAKPIRVGDRVLIQGLWRDITERKEAEERLRKLAAELEGRVQERTEELQLVNSSLLQEIAQRSKLEREILEISEREQRRIGHDLHDSLGQRLAGLKFMSGALVRRLAKNKLPGVLSAVRIERELQHAIEETRQIARGLHPIRPDGESLRSALYELSLSVSKLFRVPCRFESSGTVVVHDYHAATHLYRIAQEAVGNAIRHARPKHIWIKLQRTNRHLRLVVEDDGRGLPAKTENGHGLGLSIMKHRASLLGAALVIAKRHGGGTRIACDWKLPATEEKSTHHAG